MIIVLYNHILYVCVCLCVCVSVKYVFQFHGGNQHGRVPDLGVAAKVPSWTLFAVSESLAFNALSVTRVPRDDNRSELIEDGSPTEPSLISAATKEMRLRIVCTSWNLISVGNQSNHSKCKLQ